MGATDERRVDEVLARLRHAHPDAVASGLDDELRRVPVPAELGFAPASSPATDAETGIATIALGDRAAVVRAFDKARTSGTASVAAHRIDGAPVRIHYVDLRSRYGLVLILAVPDDGLDVDLPEELVSVTPRTAWARIDADGLILECGPTYAAVFGFRPDEVVGTSALPFIHVEDHARLLDNWIEVLGSPGQPRRYRARHLRGDGTYVWIDVTNVNRVDDPEHGDVLSELVDVSHEMQATELLREREQLLRELTDALPVGVLQFGRSREVVHENERFRVIAGHGGLAGFLASVDADDRLALLDALDDVAAGSVPAPLEVHLPGDRVCSVTLRPLHDGGGLACVDDVTEAAQMRAELEWRAGFDALTACYSRSAILAALDDAAAGSGPNAGTGVVFVDLDRFKPVNDELGHAAGDQLLATVGERLRRAVRDGDLVGRLGGDEFLVVCPGTSGLADVQAVADRVATLLGEPLDLPGDHVVHPHASIGVAWAPAGTSPSALVARADSAMYESKRRSRAGS